MAAIRVQLMKTRLLTRHRGTGLLARTRCLLSESCHPALPWGAGFHTLSWSAGHGSKADPWRAKLCFSCPGNLRSSPRPGCGSEEGSGESRERETSFLPVLSKQDTRLLCGFSQFYETQEMRREGWQSDQDISALGVAGLNMTHRSAEAGERLPAQYCVWLQQQHWIQAPLVQVTVCPSVRHPRPTPPPPPIFIPYGYQCALWGAYCWPCYTGYIDSSGAFSDSPQCQSPSIQK